MLTRIQISIVLLRGDICPGINLLHCFNSKDQIKQLKPLSCPPTTTTREEFGVTYLSTSANPQKINFYKKVRGGGGGFSPPISKTPFVNSLLNPWSSNRIEIARRIGSAELDSTLLRY
ncbi:hypothetical protein CEXT_411561 [Caerostris extrusa]|uniref:Uncharacterized protein n=1 Tax=Caerostris extrusa TaxID=172846 RepID=A0AAV4NVG7_CAEEX|nr:hypothetical protein CEXT_411561 [Caerostris extrusa]